MARKRIIAISAKRKKANRQYRSSVFASYFSEKKERLIDLYNAFSIVKYPPDTPIEVNTLDSALFNGFINDVSFVLNNMLIVLIEHQSTFNPNMPFRILLYLTEILQRRHSDPKPFYRSSLQKIEKVRCLVLYNGTEDRPDKSILKLSDAYQHVADDIGDPSLDIQLELLVPVYNITNGRNPQILASSRPLKEYSLFVAKVKEEEATGKSLSQAMESAVKYCIANNIMANYLKTHQTEVYGMLWQGISVKDYGEVKYDEGLEHGITKASKTFAIKMIKANKSDYEIQEFTDLTIDEIQQLRGQYT